MLVFPRFNDTSSYVCLAGPSDHMRTHPLFHWDKNIHNSAMFLGEHLTQVVSLLNLVQDMQVRTKAYMFMVYCKLRNLQNTYGPRYDYDSSKLGTNDIYRKQICPTTQSCPFIIHLSLEPGFGGRPSVKWPTSPLKSLWSVNTSSQDCWIINSSAAQV